jgi:hypothetical protein
LANLKSSLYGNDKLEGFVEEILKNSDSTLNSRLRSEMGIPETGEEK